jgi:glutathione S-transferase
MALAFYGHPLSSYCQKVLVALYENATPFDFRLVAPGEPAAARFAELWPIRRMPLVVDDGRSVVESTIIIEYLGQRHPGPVALVPDDPGLALEARFLDRVFDHYLMTPMQKIVFDCMRPADGKDPLGVADARDLLDRSYRWLEERLAGRDWAAGAVFTLADCAAAPSLFYADWVHPIGDDCTLLRAYRSRLLARPSFARAVDEARPFRHYFPPGAPDRD